MMTKFHSEIVATLDPQGKHVLLISKQTGKPTSPTPMPRDWCGEVKLQPPGPGAPFVLMYPRGQAWAAMLKYTPEMQGLLLGAQRVYCLATREAGGDIRISTEKLHRDWHLYGE